ncbi:MAG: methyltransferase domain-containing protein [Anaerolineae bacterium]|nr:methyltransferase domain-containing protein [Anaerolineae bacterium]
MADVDPTIRALEVSDPLLAPIVRAAIQALALAPGSCGLDVGCGTGLQAVRLAQAVGPGGQITGLDISPALLHRAAQVVDAAGLAGRISLREGDARTPPFEDDAFDWAWSSCCVAYAASIPPLPALREMARVVRRGGKVATLVWSSEQLLPGYPLLEARLRATAAGIAPYVRGGGPETHFMRALGWYREAGLTGIAAQTFVGGAHAPLAEDVRGALAALLAMRWPGAEAELGEADRALYRRLCLPSSPAFILDHPDYCAFYTCTLFHGVVP